MVLLAAFITLLVGFPILLGIAAMIPLAAVGILSLPIAAFLVVQNLLSGNFMSGGTRSGSPGRPLSLSMNLRRYEEFLRLRRRGRLAS